MEHPISRRRALEVIVLGLFGAAAATASGFGACVGRRDETVVAGPAASAVQAAPAAQAATAAATEASQDYNLGRVLTQVAAATPTGVPAAPPRTVVPSPTAAQIQTTTAAAPAASPSPAEVYTPRADTPAAVTVAPTAATTPAAPVTQAPTAAATATATAAPPLEIRCAYITKAEVDRMLREGTATPEQMTALYRRCEDLETPFRNYPDKGTPVVNTLAARFVPDAVLVAPFDAEISYIRIWDKYDRNPFLKEGTMSLTLIPLDKDGQPSKERELSTHSMGRRFSEKLEAYHKLVQKGEKDVIVKAGEILVKRGDVLVEGFSLESLVSPDLVLPPELGASNFMMYIIIRTNPRSPDPYPNLSKAPNLWFGGEGMEYGGKIYKEQ